MKKYLKTIIAVLCVIACVIALVACTPECTEHVDVDGNGTCDNCGEAVENNPAPECTHADRNLDEKCDLCGEDRPINDGKETYSVYVSNGIGGGYADLVIEFKKGEETIAMSRTYDDGYAYVRLALDLYDVSVIDALGRNLYYETENLKVTPTKKNLVIEAASIITSNEQVSLMESSIMNSRSGYLLEGEGSFRVNVTTESNTPLVWVAEETGIYTFTFVSEFGVEMSYYGTPMLIYEVSLVDEKDVVSDSCFKLTIGNSNLSGEEREATPHVIGIKAKLEAGVGTLKIQRTGDAPLKLADLPWTVYNGYIPGDLNLPETLTEADLTYLDLTVPQTIVYNATDKLYHLGSENGKVVYVQMKHTPTTLPSAPAGESKDYFTLEGLISNDHMGAYIFRDGIVDIEHLISKNSYQEHAQACLNKAHEEAGIYYLTEGLMKGIQESGESRGWWKLDSEFNIFKEKGEGIIIENAWMFCLCTID